MRATALLISIAISLRLTAAESVALTNVNVLPLTPGSATLINQTVLIRDGKIAQIGPVKDIAIPRNIQRISLPGRYLMPGLTDTHVHLQHSATENRAMLKLFLANGVTTIFSLAGTPAHLELRDRIRRGQAVGPTIYTSGRQLGDPVGRPTTTTPEEIEQSVISHKRDGYDFIKLHGDLSSSTYQRLVQVARRENIPLIGHAPRNLGVEPMLQQKQQVVAHLEEYLYAYYFFQRNTAEPIPDLDRKIRDLATRTASAGTSVITTLAVYKGIPEQIANIDKVLARPEVQYLPRSIGDSWGWWPPNNTYVRRFRKDTVAWFERQYELLKRTAKAFHDAGVPLLAGTDTPTAVVVPGFSIQDELEELVAAGFTPLQALQSATTTPAAFLGLTKTAGTVEVGKQANLIVLQRNPLENISAVSTVKGVLLNGKWIPEAQLISPVSSVRPRPPAPGAPR